MDTKSRKYKPFTAWLCFFLAISIISGLLITGLAALAHSEGNVEVLKAPFTDYKSSIVFKERTGHYYEQLLSLIADSSHPGYQEWAKKSIDDEGENLIYYAVNQDTDLVVKNIESDLSPISNAKKIANLPTGYNYFWYFDGQKVWVIDNGQPVDVKRLDSGYRGIVPNLRSYTDTPADLANIRLVLAVKDTLEKNPYGYSPYYMEQQLLPIIGWGYIATGVLGIAFLVYAIIRRREKREFDRKLAAWSGQMWLEVKMLLSLLVLTLSLGFSYSYHGGWGNAFEWLGSIILVSCFMLLGLWWFYLLLVDLLVNRRQFFTHNSINSLINWYHKYEKKYSWQKSMLKRTYMLLLAEGILALMSVFFLICAILSGSMGSFMIAVIIAAIGIYLIYRYLHRYNQTISDMGKLLDHIERIKSGDMKTRLELAADADMYPAAQNLNFIQEGMSIAVAEKTKSERMKIELITNVSHDLKTPLTSIISYADLLAKEPGLPEHVNDYIQILVQKSERLKNLIQDLFDLSKASSDNITLDMEQIDLARLIKQTLADMEEQINASGLAFRLNIPDEPVYILSDGKKLYRVWENLITNTLKYSLTGSRVFIDLTINDNRVLATIKNTANYEMDFGEEEILQRFVRGDESRTTEGSGLGLAIAQSFAQICGGKFAIKIDGDLFKVELQFDLIRK